MADQRRGAADRSRRAFLRTAGLVGTGALAGCLTGGTDTNGGRSPVSILAAGSLQHALEHGLQPAVDVPIQVEAHGSATVARMLAEGQRDPDIVAVADTALFAGPLSPPWYAVFTSNAVVLAYNAETDGGERIAAAGPERWYEPLLDETVSLGRTDPEQDPLGYRTLFTLALASRYYEDAPDLRERVPTREQVYPETALLSQFETGSIDAAVAYRNMAVERGYDYLALPAQIDLSDPAHATEWYGTVAYELPSGQRIRGSPISYGATLRTSSDDVRSVFATLTTGQYLADAGFLRRGQFPRFEGTVPDPVRDAVSASTTTVVS